MDEKQHFDIELEEIVPEYYSKNKYIQKIFFKRHEIALEYLAKIKPKKIIDLGCGDGLFTQKIHKKFPKKKIVGIDYNVNTEKLNKKIKGVSFKRDDMFNLKIKEKFDAVTCLDVIEHFEDIDTILDEIEKIMTPKGYFILSGPVESFWYKLGRLVTKGTFSQESGPGAGKHYYNVIQLDKIIQKRFRVVEKRKIRFIFHLFDVNIYQK